MIGHQTTSEKLLYGSQPGLSDLAKNLTRHVKLMARSSPVLHLGYSEVYKGYVLFYLSNRTFFFIRHVIFMEDAFPFANESGSNYHPIFVDTVHGSG